MAAFGNRGLLLAGAQVAHLFLKRLVTGVCFVQVLAWHIFLKHNLIEEFDLDHIKLVQFFRQVERGQKDNPYHSATHVADVVQSVHCLLSKGWMQRFVGRLELLAALVAAIIHDFEHKGLNNDFLIKTGVSSAS